MEGRSNDQRRTGRSSRLVSRLISFGVLAFSMLMLLAACGPEVEKPYSTTSPASVTADDIHGLYKIVFWLSLIVFVGVQFALVYISLRYRRKKSDSKRPPQIHGNKRLELIWTIIPAVVLLVMLVPTIDMLYSHDDMAQDPAIEIDVFGKQWWWEFHYMADDAQGGQDLEVITANEIVIPEDTNVVFNLQSNNVIHSFWVPKLSGKLDVVPGHVNKLSITATEPGDYYGECAEYCGAQHAWMRFKIRVVPQEEFYAWVNNWRSSPQVASQPNSASGEVLQAPEMFSVCLSCHTVNGSDGPPLVTGINAPANMGPDLTMVGCRETIAAGMLENTPENLEAWLRDPASVKPGNAMSTQIGPGQIELTDEQIAGIVDFVYNDLTPPGGCETADGWNASGTPEASPVASPEAGN